ncbi:alanine dehydrogenase [Sanguibacter sp. 4.1]|uniref:Alanine dehydrogenase n=1 Tax=Sanguibacter biliveldensis TaxID=3030830 RepID=A0AAF0Z440_9MICO|nr:alanine dehydrogenase [Sanguibacter sp. 4.1]WPF80827.1 alanine dehydrogenase [Sanguibacter sp. 4.1]
MRIAVPTETKTDELRVALTADGAHHLVSAGHEVVVQAGAGLGSAVTDADYEAAGARVVPGAEEVWAEAELVVKVKEPQPSEHRYLRPGLTLFTYLHLAADRACTQALLDTGTTSFAYETVRLADGRLPLLAPMSEVAGRLATQVGAYHLTSPVGGAGLLMGGVPGTRPARVVVLGGGTAGRNAAQVAAGMRADVTVLDLEASVLASIDREHSGAVRTVTSTAAAVDREVAGADLVVGAVLVPGALAPRLVSDELVSRMRPGSVLVDVAVDQGGCFEGTRPTTHSAPTYTVHGSIFYAVANMPGAVPVTSTQALTNATLPYVSRLAALGGARDLHALAGDPALAAGLATYDGTLAHREVAQAHGLDWVDRFAPAR